MADASPPSLPIITIQIRTYTPLLPGTLHTFGWRPNPNYWIRHDPLVRAEYPFKYSPPHFPLGEPDPPSADHSQAPANSHAPLYETFHRGSTPADDRLDSPSPPKEAELEARAQPAENPNPQGALPSGRLSFLTLNAQKADSNSPSLANVVSFLDLHPPYFLLLTETSLLSDNGALTHILRNSGNQIRCHPINAPSPPDTFPEARLPDHLTHPGD